jgi:hypothetical protein
VLLFVVAVVLSFAVSIDDELLMLLLVTAGVEDVVVVELDRQPTRASATAKTIDSVTIVARCSCLIVLSPCVS